MITLAEGRYKYLGILELNKMIHTKNWQITLGECFQWWVQKVLQSKHNAGDMVKATST